MIAMATVAGRQGQRLTGRLRNDDLVFAAQGDGGSQASLLTTVKRYDRITLLRFRAAKNWRSQYDENSRLPRCTTHICYKMYYTR